MSDSAWGDREAQGAGKHPQTGPRLPQMLLLFPRRSLWETKADGSQRADGQQQRILGWAAAENPWQDREHHTKLKHWNRKKQLREKDHQHHEKPLVIEDLSWRPQWPSWVCGAAAGSGSGMGNNRGLLLQSRTCLPCPCARWERAKGSTCSPHFPAESSQPVAS